MEWIPKLKRVFAKVNIIDKSDMKQIYGYIYMCVCVLCAQVAWWHHLFSTPHYARVIIKVGAECEIRYIVWYFRCYMEATQLGNVELTKVFSPGGRIPCLYTIKSWRASRLSIVLSLFSILMKFTVLRSKKWSISGNLWPLCLESWSCFHVCRTKITFYAQRAAYVNVLI